jgi:RNA ligase (TIGR02306 family)
MFEIFRNFTKKKDAEVATIKPGESGQVLHMDLPRGECKWVSPPRTEPVDDGSTYKVPFTTIVDITAHDKSDFLEFAWVYGFQVIVKKDSYKVGDQVIYVPIDSLLPKWLEDHLFPEGSKIKLHNHRVRQIKIRGYASQGMLISPSDVASKIDPVWLVPEQDLKNTLEITKYEPSQPGFAQTQGKGKNRNKKHEHPLFHKYNGLDNIKWFPTLFKEGDEVVIECKLHGTNARASKLPFIANTFIKKLKKFFGLAPKVEKCYGSNNVDISAATNFKGYYGDDIYGKCFNSLDVFNKLVVGEIVYGEIIGPGIQKNYDYSLKEHHFVVFDVKTLQPDGKFKWMNPEEVKAFCDQRGFEFVPILYKGPYNKELAYSLTKGPSVYDPKTKVREGIVIKAANNYDVDGNKKALKWVSETYLDDKNNTDFH